MWPTFAAAAAADWSIVVVVVAAAAAATRVLDWQRAAVVAVAAHLNIGDAVAAAGERCNRACRVDIQDRMIPRMGLWTVVDG